MRPTTPVLGVADGAGVRSRVGGTVGAEVGTDIGMSVGGSVGVVAAASPGNTPPQFSSTRARILATERRSLSIAELVAAKRRRFSSPEYWPLHSAKALTTISRSVGPAGVGIGVRVGADATVGVGCGVSVGETVGGAAVAKAVAVGGNAAVGDGGNAGASEGAS